VSGRDRDAGRPIGHGAGPDPNHRSHPEPEIEQVPDLPPLDQAHQPAWLTPHEQLALEAHAAAFVLGALAPHEEAAFERHLHDCAYCRHLVGELSQATEHLPDLVTPVETSPQLKERLMAAVRQEPEGSREQGGHSIFHAIELPPPADRHHRLHHRRGPLFHRLPLPWRSTPPWASAALAAAAIVLAIIAMATGQQARQEALRASAYERALELAVAGRIIPLSASGTTAPQGQVALIVPRDSATGAQLVIIKLSDPPPGRTYEAWLIVNETPNAAATFQGTGGVMTLPLRGDPSRAQAIAVTIEPQGGSPTPTSQPILMARL